VDIVNFPVNAKARSLFVGLSTVDMIYEVDHIPAADEKLSVVGQHIEAGGPATNAAVTFAYLGGRSTLITAVGKHPLGTIIQQDLGRFGISCYDVGSAQCAPPPVSSVFIIPASGARTVVSANANAFSSVDYHCDVDWFESVSVVMVDGVGGNSVPGWIRDTASGHYTRRIANSLQGRFD
jgi:sugar/nucleoside kinase (ribokinase family)